MRRLLGRLVRQAKDYDIDFAVELPLCGRVLARLGRQTQEFDAGNARELFPDLKAGSSGFAVDEDFRRHDRLCSSPKAEQQSRSRANSRVSASDGSDGRASVHETRLSYKRPSWSRRKRARAGPGQTLR